MANTLNLNEKISAEKCIKIAEFLLAFSRLVDIYKISFDYDNVEEAIELVIGDNVCVIQDLSGSPQDLKELLFEYAEAYGCLALNKTANLPRDFLTPDWNPENIQKCHDWRNHIDPSIRLLWSTFTYNQKVALATVAVEAAKNEVWDEL